MDGVLALRGGNATAGNGGGGSGGSVLIKTINMTGHGLIAVNGGNGVGTGGGGSGGRAGIHCQWRYQFGGQFDNFGGDGGPGYKSVHAGASGTTYKEENFREMEYRLKKYDKKHNTTFLAVDHTYVHSSNIGKYSPAATLIMEAYRDVYEFDEMELSGSTRLQLYHPNNITKVKLTVHLFIGDRTGQLHLKRQQIAFIEVIESMSNRTEAPCGYLIEDGAEIVFPTETHIHGANSTYGGVMTGIKQLYIEDEALVVFRSTSQTAMLENGSYTYITERGNFSFDTFTVKRGGRAQMKKVIELMYLAVSEMRVKYQGLLYMNDAEISSSYAWVESEGVFHFDGQGYGSEEGPGSGSTVSGVGLGGSHGGYGGMVNTTMSSDPYDSVYTPKEYGCGGGNGGGVGGAGGGRLLWRVGKRIQLNGLLSLQGMDATGSDAGGGSGGALLITTTNITGHGEVSVAGGNGIGLGAGGAGGRVGIHCRWRYWYGGKFTDRGGSGGAGYEVTHGAAAGTVFVENNLRPLSYRVLKYAPGTNETHLEVDHHYVHIDNEGSEVPVPTMIMEDETTKYVFDELLITGHSRLVFYQPAADEVNVTVHCLMGDKTGRIHIRNKQRLFSEVVESVSNVTEAPCSYIIDYGAELVLPTEVHLHGTNTVLDGLISGVHHLYIEGGATVAASSTAQTSLTENRKIVYLTDEGNFTMATINLCENSALSFKKVDSDLTVTASMVEVKYRGTIQMNHGFFDVGDFDLEAEGLFNLSASGNSGPGDGAGVCGGSYGGQAGGEECASLPYGSVFRPTQLGSGGAGVGAGVGGGHVNLRVGRQINVNGLLTVAGGNANSGANAGGGSGGTILIEAYNITGHGTLDASGGTGRGTGGGGGGGRIGLHITFGNRYGGKYLAAGGATSTVNRTLASTFVGGPGTIYKYESNHGPQYRELKYNPRLNVTAVKPDHRQLTVDNLDLVTSNPAIVMEAHSDFYEFEEVQVLGHSYVQFYHPTGMDKVNIIVHEVTGNKKGRIRVQSRQHLAVSFVESTHTYLDAPCGFHVDVDGEIVVPTVIIILAESFILEGQISGVEQLIVERGGEFVIAGEGHTAGDTAGHVQLQTLTVNNAGQLTTRMDTGKPLLDVAIVVVKAGGVVSTQSLTNEIKSSTMEVEKTGLVTGTGFGYASETGPGASHNVSGAGHAGRG